MFVEGSTIGFLRHIVKKDGQIDIPSQGNSMYPFIKEGDICTFNRCDPCDLKKGDVALFHTSDDQLVAHRFYRAKQLDGKRFYLFKGDTNLGFDHPVRATQIIGKLDTVQKGNWDIGSGDWLAGVWARIITSQPFVSALLRKYLNRRGDRSLQF